MSLSNCLFLLLVLVIVGCSPKATVVENGTDNPSASLFNVDESDAQAIMIADKVMDAMGGRDAWDNTQYIKWDFFGRRKHTWDKKNNLSRIEVPSDSLISIINIKENTGRFQKKGIEVTDAEEKAELLKSAQGAWINDSYWLVMPFKLKDNGVTLNYVGRDTTTDGRNAEVLSLTFNDVGVTPDNKYHVYVDDETNLITQWDFYSGFLDSLPRFQSPWPDYKRYGDILLSGGQIRGGKMGNIQVLDKVATQTFSKF